jgi:hypothetical protein
MIQERAEQVAWAVGAIGLALALLGWLLEPVVFSHAWLAALSSWIGWPLGCIALLLAHTLTGGRWGDTIRPQLLAGIGTLPLLVPALLPMVFVLPVLYPWWHPDTALHLDNGFYLNRPFAVARAIIYLVAWYGTATATMLALRFWRIPPAVAVIGLLLLGLTASFAAIDATMSLDPHFSSSDYGMMAAAEAGLLALSVCVLLATIGPPLSADELNDLGRLLQGLLVLWAYLDFVQLLIVSQGDLPHEAPWYVERTSHGWGALSAIVAFGHFLLPFFVLLWPPLRRSSRVLGATAALLIVMELLRAWWLVLPAGHRGFSWIDIAAMAAIWGFSAALALRGPTLRLAFAEPGHG